MDRLNVLASGQHEESCSQLDRLLNGPHKYRERFLVNKSDELIMLYADNISYIIKTESNVLAFVEDGTSYLLAMTMAELEQDLDPDKFFRINRQYIANIKSIVKIRLFFNSKLIVKLKGCDDNDIMISKEKAAQFRKWLDR